MQLTPRQQEVYDLRIANPAPMSPGKVGYLLGMSRQRVQQIEAAVRRKLADADPLPIDTPPDLRVVHESLSVLIARYQGAP